MSQLYEGHRPLEERAAETFEALEASQDSFIVMGRSQAELGAKFVQLVCFPPDKPGASEKRLELVTSQRGRQMVATNITDVKSGLQQSYSTMMRAALNSVQYHIIGTGTNVADVAQALVTEVEYLKYLPSWRHLSGLMVPEEIPPRRPQVTGSIFKNSRQQILYGFAALRPTSDRRSDSEEIELLTRVPEEGAFPDDIKPGIGLLLRSMVLDPQAPRPPRGELLSPAPLGGSCDDIADAFMEKLPKGSQVAVKIFDFEDYAQFAIRGPES